MTWYNTNWKYRKKITIDNTKVGADLIDYPVYLDLSELGTDFFDNVKSDGGDIRITTSDEETEVPREIVSCDTTAETGEVHFKGDLSGSTDTDFYVYYGNSEASDYAITATYGAENVWNSNYKGVYHLEDANDSTSNSNDGTVSGATSGATGQIEDAYSFDGSNDYIDISSLSKLQEGVAHSLSGIFKIDADITTEDYQSLIVSGTGVSANRVGVVYRQVENSLAYGIYDGSNYVIAESGSVSQNTFHHFYIFYNGTSASLYIDGVLQSGSNTPALSDDDLFLLGRDSDIGSKFFDGILDEIRIANSGLGSDWGITEYNNLLSPSTFYTIGIQEESKISSNTIFLSNNF